LALGLKRRAAILVDLAEVDAETPTGTRRRLGQSLEKPWLSGAELKVRIQLPPAASQTNSHPNRRGPRRISRLSAIGISRRPRGPSSTTGQDGRHQARPRQERWLTPGRVARARRGIPGDADRLGADRTVGAGRLYGHARGTGDQRLDTSLSIEPCACPSLHLLPLCCPAPLTPCLAVRKGHSRDIPMDLFTTGQVGGGMRFHSLSRSSG